MVVVVVVVVVVDRMATPPRQEVAVVIMATATVAVDHLQEILVIGRSTVTLVAAMEDTEEAPAVIEWVIAVDQADLVAAEMVPITATK
jgi:hypothetical protein